MKKYKSAKIHARANKVFVSSNVKTDTGLDVTSGPYSTFDNQVSASTLGAAIKDAVWKSFEAEPIEHPSDFSDYPNLNEFLSLVGCRSWSKFVRDSVACRVSIYFHDGPQQGQYLLRASIPEKGGLSGIGEKVELPNDVTDEALGEAVMERLKWAREQT